uniref:Hydroxyacylglutathione hydrolase, putative n=1 Tax=Chlorobium chlorochromatii (strain CaD3) TaxID=340177 RepID=Q3AUC2_CHLCH
MSASQLVVKQIRTGGDRNFAYIAACTFTQEAMVVDASYNPAMVATVAANEGFTIRYIFSTHSHVDHTNGNAELSQLCGVPALLYGDMVPDLQRSVLDGTVLPLGKLNIQILHTPGHTPDSISLYCDNALFTGDTLFVGKVGGTYSDEDARTEYESLWQKLMVLPDATMVYPGHDYGVAPTSTLAHERQTNPFLQQKSFNDFLSLKKNWAAYKKAHGIV